MKAALLPAYDSELSLEDVPPPEVTGASDVIVRVGGAGLCRTDLHIIEGIWKEKVNVELPYILGHENAGWVEDVGPGVRSVKPGDAVIVHPVITCGLCQACRAGEDMHCIDLAFPGITQNGGFAEYLLTGERAVIPLPEGLEPKAIAPYADAGITAYRAARRAAEPLTPGTRTAIIGVGGLGHIAVQVLGELCATEIIAVNRSPAALKLVGELGRAPPGGRLGGRPGRGGDGADRRRGRPRGHRLRRRGQRDRPVRRDAAQGRHLLGRRLRRAHRGAGDRHDLQRDRASSAAWWATTTSWPS